MAFIFKPRGTEPHVESRARDQAVWLIRDHGDDAEAILAAKRRRPNVSAGDRYRYQLTARALRALRSEDRASSRRATERAGLLGLLRRMLFGRSRDNGKA